MEIWLQRTRLSADNGVSSSSEPSGIGVIGNVKWSPGRCPIICSALSVSRIIGIVKWKSGSSELDCQLTTGRSAHQNHQALALSVAWNEILAAGWQRLSADNGVISSSEPSGIGVIGSVKWNQAPLRVWLSADNRVFCASVAAGNRIIGIMKWKPRCWLAAIVGWQRI